MPRRKVRPVSVDSALIAALNLRRCLCLCGPMGYQPEVICPISPHTGLARLPIMRPSTFLILSSPLFSEGQSAVRQRRKPSRHRVDRKRSMEAGVSFQTRERERWHVARELSASAPAGTTSRGSRAWVTRIQPLRLTPPVHLRRESELADVLSRC